jgi:hypothetical protein
MVLVMQTTTTETPRCKEIAKSLKAQLKARGIKARTRSSYNSVVVTIVDAGMRVHTDAFLYTLAVLNEYTSGLDRWTDIFTPAARQVLDTVEHDAKAYQYIVNEDSDYGSIPNYYARAEFDRQAIEKKELVELDQELIADLKVLYAARGREETLAHIRRMS